MTTRTSNLAFLLGVPRSGTTLLAQLLGAHPEVTAPPEPWLLLALESFGRTPARHPADSQLLSRAIDELLGRVARNRVLRALADEVYAQYRHQASASCFVDKTPRYWLILEFLEALYPEAPTLVLFRNPYAIAASLKMTWGVTFLPDADRGPEAPYIADLALGLAALLEHTERRPALRMHYEQLVRAPAAEQAKALAHLGRSASELAAPGTLSEKDSARTSFGDTKIRGRRMIDPSSLDTWQEQLDRDELQFVTELLGAELFTRLGYGDELDTALRLGARLTGAKPTHESQHRWRHWLASNRVMVRHAGSWPALDDDVTRRIEQLEAQAAVYHDSALNTDRLLRECNEDRRQLRDWVADAERRLEESNTDRQALRAWAEDAERRASR